MTERGLRKKLIGTVVSNRMQKSALVLVERLTRHRKYGKYVRRRAKYMVHDPQHSCRIGDRVTVIESRPISKKKRWQLFDIIEKSRDQA